ncbi:MAG: hypothetical protein FWE31_05965 [Firmicutes bacterium]|nr:hypothetical protein [Bacillota bacterium]
MSIKRVSLGRVRGEDGAPGRNGMSILPVSTATNTVVQLNANTNGRARVGEILLNASGASLSIANVVRPANSFWEITEITDSNFTVESRGVLEALPLPPPPIPMVGLPTLRHSFASAIANNAMITPGVSGSFGYLMVLNQAMASNAVGTFAFSANGINWQQRNAGGANNIGMIVSLAYGNGRIVAGCMNNRQLLVSSDNAATWQRVTSPSATASVIVCFHRGAFFHVSHGSRNVFRSTDGVNWTTFSNALPTSTNIVSGGEVILASDGTRLLLFDGTGRLLESTNGEVWHLVASGLPTNISSVAIGKGAIVVVRNSYEGLYTSIDGGKTWENTTPASRVGWISVAYGGGLFLASSAGILAGRGTENLFYSRDGKSWMPMTTGSANWISIIHGNGMFATLGSYANGTANTHTLQTFLVEG